MRNKVIDAQIIQIWQIVEWPYIIENTSG